jgi:hypothetical protein
MAITRGRVLELNWQSEIVCVFLGASMNNTALLMLQFHPSDSGFVLEHKRALVKLLATALTSRRAVAVRHGDSDSLITGVDFELPNISPVGPAIHEDFYGVTGAGIPDTADIVFETGALIVTVTPDVRRPYWVFIEQLPASIPAGPALVSLRAPGWQSDAVPITVRSGPRLTVRTLYPGRPATVPYTFVFAASPAIEAAGGGVSADRHREPAAHGVARGQHAVRGHLRLDPGGHRRQCAPP